MTWIPKYNLYAEDGLTLVYPFDYIQGDNSPQSPEKFVEIEGFRGQGSLIIPGSEQSWDLTLQFVLLGTNYQDVISQMDEVISTIQPNIKYILKIDRTPSTTQNYNVTLVYPEIEWLEGRRTRVQKGRITFKVNSW